MRRKNVMDYVPQEKKETVASKLEAEKQKLGELELRLRDLLATTASRRSSEDSGTITWSDEDSGKTAETVVRGDRRSKRSSESTSDLPQDSTDSRFTRYPMIMESKFALIYLTIIGIA